MPSTRSSPEERAQAGDAGTPGLSDCAEHPKQARGGEKARGARMRHQATGQHSPMPLATETREVLLALEPRAESARLARRALLTHGLDEDVEHTVTLLATEIVGNAVRHAGLRADQRIVFFARLSDDFAHVEVADQGEGFEPETVETEGFGLRLLGKLASRWGVDCTDRGCRVWFEVDRRSGRFKRDS
jgi:anti-sigma regulatory factor (Ser/Thr protein kinase)